MPSSGLAWHFKWLGLPSLENVAITPRHLISPTPPGQRSGGNSPCRARFRPTSGAISSSRTSPCSTIRWPSITALRTCRPHFGQLLATQSARGGVLTQGTCSWATAQNPTSSIAACGLQTPLRRPATTTARRATLGKEGRRQALKNRSCETVRNAACARCHNKIDPWGIAFEAYDPTGRLSTTFDASTILPDGVSRRPAGACNYVRKEIARLRPRFRPPHNRLRWAVNSSTLTTRSSNNSPTI